MDLMQLISDLNYLAVLVAAIVYFAVGALWYSPLMFAATWIEDLKMQMSGGRKMNMYLTHALSFVSIFAVVWVLAIILQATTTTAEAVNVSLFIGIFMIVATSVKHYLHEGKSCRLFFINNGYEIIGMILAGLIIGSWR